MTLKNVSEQVFELSVNKYFNGTRFSKTALQKELKGAFKSGFVDSIGGKYFLETLLGDGWHLIAIYRFDATNDGFDYEVETKTATSY